MKRFPLRTLLLMLLALGAFIRFWCATHEANAPSPSPGIESEARDGELIEVTLATPLDGAATDLDGGNDGGRDGSLRPDGAEGAGWSSTDAG